MCALINSAGTQGFSGSSHNMGEAKGKHLWLYVLMFAIGALRSIDVSLVGRVSLAEVLAFGACPFMLARSKSRFSCQAFYTCLLVLVLMFVGVVVSDLVNKNFFWFSARSFARPVFMFGFFVFFLAVLTRSHFSLVPMVYGSVISGIIKYFRPSDFEVSGAQFVDSYAGFVFRVQPLITAVALSAIIFIYPRSRLLALLCFLGAGLSIAVFGGARSSILIWFAAAAVLGAIILMKSSNRRRMTINRSRLFLLSSALVIALSILYGVYVYAAPRGLLGEDQLVKFESQSNNRFGSTPWGLILSGRAQVYGAILGILDRPILGFGSWRHDLTQVYVYDAISDVGSDSQVLSNLAQGGRISGAGHSVIFQAWVENGFLPAMCLIFVFVIFARVFIFYIKYENRLTPYIVYLFFSFCWAFFFSPPGLGLRFQAGLIFATYVVFISKRGLRRSINSLSR